MRSIFAALVRKDSRRRLLAVVFLFVFLAEAGSHAVICASHSDGDAHSFSSSGGGHEDPCQTLVLCRSQRKDQKLPNLGHDASQHNALFDRIRDLTPLIEAREDANTSPSAAHCLFRPPNPPFQPPKN
jgi:hypothetical protein